jgi:hypothetical protein
VSRSKVPGQSGGVAVGAARERQGHSATGPLRLIMPLAAIERMYQRFGYWKVPLPESDGGSRGKGPEEASAPPWSVSCDVQFAADVEIECAEEQLREVDAETTLACRGQADAEATERASDGSAPIW